MSKEEEFEAELRTLAAVFVNKGVDLGTMADMLMDYAWEVADFIHRAEADRIIAAQLKAAGRLT